MITHSDKIYVFLSTLFAVFLVMANLVYQKFVSLPFPFLLSFELSVGAIIYPITYLITDLITEFYGRERARFCVKNALIMNVIIAFAIIGMDHLQATSWSSVNNDIFHKVFGQFNIAFVGSIIACYVSQLIDISLYLWIRTLTGEKWLWIRNNVSIAVSLFVDTLIVNCFLNFYNILPTDQIGKIIFNSYLFKLIFTLCNTPVFYMAVKMIRWVLERSTHPVGVDTQESMQIGTSKVVN
ncbi:MAG: queuosine precursor transporter [Alphaproteobacteria bacterium]|nr:queuosine precursor transporter [Alphaproteobacteria bacterium]